MDDAAKKKAEKQLEAGMRALHRGIHQLARDHFKASAGEYPTADAFTYWGWMEHHLGNTELAIELCEQAIELDPQFGNPYNDIGSYLVALGKPDEAVSWFEKAIQAKRYEPRQYPHMNLGRIYFEKGMPIKALEHYQKAKQYAPDDPELSEMIEKIRLSLN